MQLSLLECAEHLVDSQFFTTNPEGNWSPYDVRICVKCHKVFGYPSKEWLKTWPIKQQDDLREFLAKYGLQNPPLKNTENNEQKTGEN
jgi:hypothetical protein